MGGVSKQYHIHRPSAIHSHNLARIYQATLAVKHSVFPCDKTHCFVHMDKATRSTSASEARLLHEPGTPARLLFTPSLSIAGTAFHHTAAYESPLIVARIWIYISLEYRA